MLEQKIIIFVSFGYMGLLFAIAFESIVKLAAIISVGLFITFGLYSGFRDLFARADLVPQIRQLFVMEVNGSTFTGWYNALFPAMMAIFLLPRQFQVSGGECG